MWRCGDPEAAGAAGVTGVTGVRGVTGVTGRKAAAYVSAQTVGAVAGAEPADVMFAEPLVKWSAHERAAGHLLPAEEVATARLLLLIFGLADTGGGDSGRRAFTDTFVRIAPGPGRRFRGGSTGGWGDRVGAVTVIFRAALAPRPPTS